MTDTCAISKLSLLSKNHPNCSRCEVSGSKTSSGQIRSMKPLPKLCAFPAQNIFKVRMFSQQNANDLTVTENASCHKNKVSQHFSILMTVLSISWCGLWRIILFSLAASRPRVMTFLLIFCQFVNHTRLFIQTWIKDIIFFSWFW